MIKKLSVIKLNGNIDCSLIFNPDLNILIGKNGSGKTTLLKMVWYLISGNIERIFEEMTFESVSIETTRFKLLINRERNTSPRKVKEYTYYFDAQIEGSPTNREGIADAGVERYVESLNVRIAPITGPSLFFPTFRRVEGGFSLLSNKRHHLSNAENPLEEAMKRFSNRISVYNHSFVSTISTQDIVRLITERYAGVSEMTNSLHGNLSSNIIERINIYSMLRGEASTVSPEDVLKDIEAQVEKVSIERNNLLKPFSLLSEITNSVFKKSIRITENFVLGDAAKAISSDKLSAGEKQMLSFLCYNAFYDNIPIFIDEPELSLHTDWQRILFPSLLKQNTGNQFIIATHSPFIYAKYPDKELVLNSDRGE